MYRGCETFFQAITLNIIFYLPANYRISFSACRPTCPCSPHFGEAQGMVLSLTRLCLICSYIFTWHLPSTNYYLLFPPLCIFLSPHHSSLSSRDLLLSLGSYTSLSLQGSLPGRSADEHRKGECFALGCMGMAASAHPASIPIYNSPSRSMHHLRSNNSII